MELTLKDITALFGVPERTVYRWLKDDGLPYCRVHDQYRFNRVELLEWAGARGVSLSPAVFHGEDVPAVHSLAEVIEAGGIQADVPGQTKAEVIAHVVRGMPVGPGLDTEFLLDVLLAREELGSTAVGDGFAIPHARQPIVMPMARPLVALAFLATPVDFGALDGQAVHTLFVTITPTIRVHLSLLSRLSQALRAASWRQALARRAAPGELLRVLRQVEAGWGGDTATSARGV